MQHSRKQWPSLSGMGMRSLHTVATWPRRWSARSAWCAGLAETEHHLADWAPYRFHGELMHGALRDGQENAITWHLIHVLEKLEKRKT
jgi:hypothetical protein